MRYLFVFFLVFSLGPAVVRADEASLSPQASCRRLGWMLNDMLQDLGPAQSVEKNIQPAKIKKMVSQPVVASEPAVAEPDMVEATYEPIVSASRIVKHTKYQFSEASGLVKVEVTIMQTVNGFEEKVDSSVPINFWYCYDRQGQLVAAGKVPDLTLYYCYIKEPFNPPYKMVLHITYAGKANQIELPIE